MVQKVFWTQGAKVSKESLAPPKTSFAGKRAEYCFESTVSEERTHWVLRKTRWVLSKTRWVRFGTKIIGWEELTEFAPRNSVRAKKLTEFGVWNRTLRNRIRPVSDLHRCNPISHWRKRLFARWVQKTCCTLSSPLLGIDPFQGPWLPKNFGSMRWKRGKDPHPQDFSLTKKTARFTNLENPVTSLNKEVRPFFLSDNSIWSFPSVSSLSDYSIWRSWLGYSSLAITAFGDFQFIVPKYYYRLGKMEFKESSLPKGPCRTKNTTA